MRKFIVPLEHPTNNPFTDCEFLSLIQPLYAESCNASPSLPAVTAVAWATSAPFAGRQYCLGEARRKYLEAITKLRLALKDPSTARRDDTLLAVLLLGWIEV